MDNTKSTNIDLEKIQADKELWRKFEFGDHLTDQELDYLIKQTEAARPYLEARSPWYNLALFPTRQDLMKLLEFRENRKHKLWREKQ